MAGWPFLRGAAPPGSSRIPGPEPWPCYVSARPALLRCARCLLRVWPSGPRGRTYALIGWARGLPASRLVLAVIRPMSAAYPLTAGHMPKVLNCQRAHCVGPARACTQTRVGPGSLGISVMSGLRRLLRACGFSRQC